MSFIDKAKDVASRTMHKASEVTADLADKAGPAASKAGGYAAKGVDRAADSLNKATKGRYAEQIDRANHKVSQVLDRSGSKPTRDKPGSTTAQDEPKPAPSAQDEPTPGTQAQDKPDDAT